jgi:type I restriction enzyme S subunit
MQVINRLETDLRKRSQLGERFASAAISALAGIAIEQAEDEPVKAPQTELIAPLRLGQMPDVKAQAPAGHTPRPPRWRDAGPRPVAAFRGRN